MRWQILGIVVGALLAALVTALLPADLAYAFGTMLGVAGGLFGFLVGDKLRRWVSRRPLACCYRCEWVAEDCTCPEGPLTKLGLN